MRFYLRHIISVALLLATTLTVASGGAVTGTSGDDPAFISGKGDTLRSPSGEDSIGMHSHLRPSEYRYAGRPRYTFTGEMPNRSTSVRPVPMALTGTAVAGMLVGIHVYQSNAWWSDRRQSFHFQTDWGYAAQTDKIGHFYAGYLTSYIGYEAFVESGFSPDMAAIFGPLAGFGFQTYVEIEDGFSPFGFDPTDQVANTLGPLLFSAQHFWEPLQNVQFKWSYYPNDEYAEGVRDGHEKVIIDDYNGQTIWLSLKLGNILPEELGWPRWLRLAGGIEAYNVDRWDEQDRLLTPGRRYFISLDYDFVEMIPDAGSFGNWVLQTLGYFHFPAPALQLAPEVKFYLAWPVVF